MTQPNPRSLSLAAHTVPAGRSADRSQLRTAVYMLVVLTAGAYLPSPLYPGYQAMFGIGDLLMTVVYATFALVSAPALVLCGSVSDAVGPRLVLRASLLLAALGSACFLFASGPAWLLAGRAAQGFALGAATGAAGALISARSGGRRAGSGAVLASIAFVSGTAAGPVAGGFLAEYAPAPHLVPFVLHLVLLGFGWCRVAGLDASVPAALRWKPALPEVPCGMRRLFATAAASGFLAWTVAGLFLAVIPTLLTRTMQAGTALVGCVLGAVLICSVLTQPFVPRIGTRAAQLSGLGALLVSLGLLAATAGGSVAVTLIAAVVAGCGHGLAYGGAASAIDVVAPADKRGAITGALHLAFYLGAGCPAVVVGLITLGHSLATATTWVTAGTAALVPMVAVAVVLVAQPRIALVTGNTVLR
ncbi:MFS transporter [Sciscionella marina]|uniref:MFS transporter n=1 Tax=Sciscionella marina TaxID=508770 RepID=UPI00196A09DC|nr:MFS transporter [Sciscionella marina]